VAAAAAGESFDFAIHSFEAASPAAAVPSAVAPVVACSSEKQPTLLDQRYCDCILPPATVAGTSFFVGLDNPAVVDFGVPPSFLHPFHCVATAAAGNAVSLHLVAA